MGNDCGGYLCSECSVRPGKFVRNPFFSALCWDTMIHGLSHVAGAEDVRDCEERMFRQFLEGNRRTSAVQEPSFLPSLLSNNLVDNCVMNLCV